MDYRERYFNTLEKGRWHQVKNIPVNVGFAGLVEAAKEQILMPESKITIGHYYATFRIDKVHIANKNNYVSGYNQKTA